MALRRTEFRVVPRDVREWGRFFAQVEVDADSVQTDSIADGNVTLPKIADIAADRILGRITTGGSPTELTAAEVSTLIQDAFSALNLTFTGDIGFHSVAATGQQADPGAPTIATVSGSGADSDINDNFAALEAAVNGIRAALNAKGLTA